MLINGSVLEMVTAVDGPLRTQLHFANELPARKRDFRMLSIDVGTKKKKSFGVLEELGCFGFG